ncbi:Pentatricopeptide repeat [Macleaya cordata]|uniref:Pentatricopeptide repeat n=1 Tax=Macleaya cordata TaxID=56857 RepID=A0A200Q4D8_MACCD|nr:Pentatricopeptide repeat [Macleaya cordata]
MRPNGPRRIFFSCKNNKNNTSLVLIRPLTTSSSFSLIDQSPSPSPPPPPNPSPFSLAENLINRGLISAAQGVVDRIVQHSPSISDFISTVNFATSRGLDINSAAYSELLRVLCTEERRFPEAFDLFNRMGVAGIFPVDFCCYVLLIDGLCFRGELDNALFVFEKMIQSGTCRPTVYLYKSLVCNLCKKCRIVEADSLCRVMELDRLTPSRVMYTSLISGYCKQEDIERAKGVYERMLKMGCKPDVCTYTILISAFYKQNRADEVDNLFDKMLADGVSPDHVMYKSLKKYPEGQGLCLTIMILQVADKNGCHIDALSIFSFVTSRSNKTVEEDVELWFRKILVSNKMCLSYDDFSTLISALCVGGKTNLARDFLDKMRAIGFQPSHSTYNSMITCLCHDGSFEDAKKFIGLMEEEHGMLPNLATYLIMVNEHCKRGNLNLAIEVLEEMNEKGLKPSVAIYDSIIGALCNDERLVETGYNMFERMLKAGVVADEVVYTTLINGYSKNGKPIRACCLFDEMIKSGIKPSFHAYAALINGLIKQNLTKKGCDYLQRMLEDGFVPDTVLYTILINQFCRNGDVSFAMDLFNLMVINKIGVNSITYRSLISGVCRNVLRINHSGGRKSEKAKSKIFHLLHQITLKPINSNQGVHWDTSEKKIHYALKLMQDMKENGLMPDLHVHNAIINGYCRAGRMRDAYEHRKLMLADGLRSNQVTYTTLIEGYIRSGEIDCAIALFNTMDSNGCVPDKVTYNTLMKGLCSTARIIDALSLSQTMIKRGLYPSKVSYERLLKSLCDICLSGGLAFKGCVPCRCNYRLQSLCDICSSSLAFKVCEEMLLHGYVLCNSNYNRLLYILCGHNKLWESHKLIDMMLKRGKSPDEVIKSHVVEACYKQREFDLAIMLKKNILVYEDG